MTSSDSSNSAVLTKETKSYYDLWLTVLQGIASKVERGQFITWFRDTAVLQKDGETLVVGLPLPMFLNWHMEHYQALTLEMAKKTDPNIEQVVYKIDSSLRDHPEKTVNLLAHFPEVKKRKLPNKSEVKMAEGVTSKILHPRYTLENFVVGTNNRLAHAACQAVSEQPGGKYNPLFLYGGVGLGKTHLLQGVGNALLRRNPKATVVYVTAEDFTNQVVEAIRTQKMDQLRKRYRPVDVLIIDDIQFIANKERTQEEFFHTFNTLYEDGRQIIISADRPPTELYLEDRLISRCERGMIADVSEPDYETRLAILTEKAKEYEIFIDTQVLQFIAEHTTKNVRELEGILMQAVAQYELEQRMPTVGSIAEIMRKLCKDPHIQEQPVGFESAPTRKATMQDVLEAVSGYYSVPLNEMIGEKRQRRIVLPRQIAMYLLKQHLRCSLTDIGQQFSNRDHTTVMHSVEKIEKSMYANSDLLKEVRALEGELKFEHR